MTRTVPVFVGDLEFPTKDLAQHFFRELRDRYKDGERLNMEDQGVISDLLSLHPEASAKIGSGVAFFTVETDSEFDTPRCFMIHRRDNTRTDFSVSSCLDGRNIRADVYEALRRAIAQQVTGFRDNFFKFHGSISVCPLVGTEITPACCHVDHAPPNKFSVLVGRWLSFQGLTLEEVEITAPSDPQRVTVMTSKRQLRSWTEFHREYAVLRMLSPRGNLSHASKR